MFGIGVPELAIVLVLALIIFGPGKLPDVAKGLGKSIKEFKKAKNDFTDDLNLSDNDVREAKVISETKESAKVTSVN